MPATDNGYGSLLGLYVASCRTPFACALAQHLSRGTLEGPLISV